MCDSLYCSLNSADMRQSILTGGTLYGANMPDKRPESPRKIIAV